MPCVAQICLQMVGGIGHGYFAAPLEARNDLISLNIQSRRFCVLGRGVFHQRGPVAQS